MKRMVSLMAIGILAVGFVSAQQGRMHHWMGNQGYDSEAVSITGDLQLRNGMICVVDNEQVFYIPNLERLVGFIDGLKEGAKVKVDGYAYGNQENQYVQPSQLTLNGKSYDLQRNTFAMGRMNGYGGSCHY